MGKLVKAVFGMVMFAVLGLITLRVYNFSLWESLVVSLFVWGIFNQMVEFSDEEKKNNGGKKK